jgi:hypothetical protein
MAIRTTAVTAAVCPARPPGGVAVSMMARADFITPAEAFRIILRSIYPQNPRLAGRIKSYEFFKQAEMKYRFFPGSEYGPPIRTRPVPDHAWLPFQALHVLRVGIWQQKIELQGSLGAVPPASINPADCAVGDLDVFGETLAIGGTTSRPDYLYRRVWCSRTDVLALVGEYVLSHAPRKLGSKSGAEYVAAYLREDLNPTIEGFRSRAIADKIKGARKFEPEYHRQMAARGVATTRGRRRNPETTTN